jgi:lipopolysaccharide export system permease protein
VFGAVLILERYIVREITARMVEVCAVLTMIFAGYSAVRFLNDAVNGLLSGETVVALVGLKVLIALEVLLPVTLYLAVVVALSRLHADSEITAMEACGVGPRRIVISVLSLALFLGLVVASLSLFVRPWAYEKIYALEAKGKEEFDIAKVEAGRFYELGEEVVFFAEKLDPAENRAVKVWVWELESDSRKVTTARNAHQINGPGEGQKVIVFRDGYHYVLNQKTEGDLMIHFSENVFRLDTDRTPPAEYRRKAASTLHLARSPEPEDVAELQWRLSTGISTVLLALLAIPLSRVAPRRDKYGKVTLAIVLFFLFYNFNLIAKTWVEEQVVGAVPGIWWVTALLGVLVLIMLPGRNPLSRLLGRRSLIRGEPLS